MSAARRLAAALHTVAAAPTPDAWHDRLRIALWIVAVGWVVGAATVFPLGNDWLEAISVFTFDRLGFLAAAALFAVAAVRAPARLTGWGRLESAMAAYLAVVALSWAMTISGKAPADLKRDLDLVLSAVLMPFTAFVIARYGGWTRSQVRTAFAVVVVAAGAALIVIGIVQALVDWRFLVALADQGVHRTRARGPYPNAVVYGAVLATLLPAALALRHLARGPRRTIVTLLCGGLCLAVVLSQVRIVWIAVPIGLLYLAGSVTALRAAALTAVAGLALTLALGAAGLDLRWLALPGGALAQTRGGIGARIADDDPVRIRVAVYATALNMVAHRPVLGFGFGGRTFLHHREGYYTSCCGVPWEAGVEAAVPHNEVLNQLILLGAVGLVVYVALLAMLWGALARSRAIGGDAPHVALVAAVQAALLSEAILAQLHDTMYITPMQVVFFFLAGLAMADAAADG